MGSPQTQTLPIIIDVVKKLEPIFLSTKRFIVLFGGRGSGKSWTVAIFLLCEGMRKKTRILCTREIQNTIKDSVHKLLADTIEKYNLSFFYQVKVDTIVGINGSEFIFKGLHRNENDIKSTEGIDYCWVEEAQSVSRKSLKVLTPTIRKEGSQIIFTYNPTNDDDPVHVDYNLAQREDALKIECNYNDNPFFPDVLKAEMEYDRAHDPDKYAHVWQGKTLKHSAAQIFYGKWAIDEFEVPQDVMYYQGADWGFSTDPAAFIRCYIHEDNLYITDEVYGVGIDIDLLPEKFSQIPDAAKWPCAGDSARPDTINYMMRHGFPLMYAVEKGKGSVEDGIAFIRSFKKIIIHPRCKHTIDEFRLYSYFTDPRTGLITKKIVDKHNHLIDALRYALEKLMKNQYSQAEASESLY